MTRNTFLVLYLFLHVGFAYAQDISGKWVGVLRQNPGGLTAEYYFEMNLKQRGDIITGTSFIAMGKSREITGLMSIRGTFDGTYFYYKDIKVLNQKGLADEADWCIKKCTFQFSEVDGNYVFTGHWTGNSRFGYCSPGTIKVAKKAPDKPTEAIVHAKDSTNTEESEAVKTEKTLTKVTISTFDDEGHLLPTELVISEKGMGHQKITSTGKHTTELLAGTYHLSAKALGYYDEAKDIELTATDRTLEVSCTLKKIRAGDSFEIANLQFERSKATISQDSEDTLNKLLAFMKANTKVKIRINGHTDNVGSNYLNRVLSFNRANAVVSYLVRHGIRKDRLTAKGFGSSVPIADNKTPEGRVKNRRVEFEILGL